MGEEVEKGYFVKLRPEEERHGPTRWCAGHVAVVAAH